MNIGASTRNNMLKEITDLLTTEQNLRVHQETFTDTMKSKLEYLCTKDTDELQGLIHGELNLLLSSSLKYKTGRFKLDAKGMNWKNLLVLTRNPGLKAPHEGYTNCTFGGVLKIDKDKNLVYSKYHGYGNTDSKIPIIKLSSLLKEKNINQEKLESFYNFLERYIGLCKVLKNKLKIKTYQLYSDSEMEWIPVVGTEIGIALNPINYKFIFKNNSKNSTRENLFIDSETMHVYLESEDSYSGGCPTEKLNMLVKGWPNLWKQLLVLEKQKKTLVLDLYKIIENLKDTNRPFRLLQKLVS